jgi:hypothetical protein
LLFTTRVREEIEPILNEACSQAYPESAICVQRFDDSLNSAIRITYRISLRSSSLREPRYPLLRVVYIQFRTIDDQESGRDKRERLLDSGRLPVVKNQASVAEASETVSPPSSKSSAGRQLVRVVDYWIVRVNDPSAGSPTERRNGNRRIITAKKGRYDSICD